MKLIATFGLPIVLGFMAFDGISHAGTVKLPYQTPGQLATKCKAAGGSFDTDSFGHLCSTPKGQVYCSKSNKKCVGDCASCGNKAVARSLAEILGNPKKRPKVLHENGGSSEPDTVNPTVLGGGNPRATPDGNMPDITGDGGPQ